MKAIYAALFLLLSRLGSTSPVSRDFQGRQSSPDGPSTAIRIFQEELLQTSEQHRHQQKPLASPRDLAEVNAQTFVAGDQYFAECYSSSSNTLRIDSRAYDFKLAAVRPDDDDDDDDAKGRRYRAQLKIRSDSPISVPLEELQTDFRFSPKSQITLAHDRGQLETLHPTGSQRTRIYPDTARPGQILYQTADLTFDEVVDLDQYMIQVKVKAGQQTIFCIRGAITLDAKL